MRWRAHSRRGGRRDERGAALTMWVLLMVPVATFAALVAMAGPQRLAARADVADAADDLATLAAGLRHGYDSPSGELSAFSMDCNLVGDDDGNMQRLEPDVLGLGNKAERERLRADAQRLREMVDRGDPLTAAEQTDYDNIEKFLAPYDALVDKQDACRRIVDAVLRDLGTDMVLGTAGAAGHELSGTYSDSLKLTARQQAREQSLVPDATDAGWQSDAAGHSACAATSTVVIYDAVHVAVAAEWLGGGWVASQVWPDGSRMAAESIGRFASANEAQAEVLHGDPTDLSDDIKCNPEYLEALDPQGRPVWVEKPDADARKLVQQAGRSSLGD